MCERNNISIYCHFVPGRRKKQRNVVANLKLRTWQDLESALSLINSQYSEKVNEQLAEAHKINGEDEKTEDVRMLLDEYGAVDMDEVDDVLDRLDSQSINRQLQSLQIRDERAYFVESSDPRTLRENLPFPITSTGTADSASVLDNLASQVKDVQLYVSQKLRDIEKIERGNNSIGVDPLPNTTQLEPGQHQGPISIPRSAPCEAVVKANENIRTELDMSLLQLRNK